MSYFDKLRVCLDFYTFGKHVKRWQTIFVNAGPFNAALFRFQFHSRIYPYRNEQLPEDSVTLLPYNSTVEILENYSGILVFLDQSPATLSNKFRGRAKTVIRLVCVARKTDRWPICCRHRIELKSNSRRRWRASSSAGSRRKGEAEEEGPLIQFGGEKSG